jgi:small subunit ribosomal protein S15
MVLLQLLLASCLSAATALVVLPACSVPRSAVAAAPAACWGLRMEEAAEAPAAPAGEAVDDFTEDLLDALAADDVPLSSMETQAVFVKSDNPDEVLEPRLAYTNYMAVEEVRQKYRLHASDTGSSQVQIAVLTARIQYLTSHMQKNKTDYASLRGLTAMVVRRRKLLEYLLQEDSDEFTRITSELNIRTNQLMKPKLQGARGRRD